MSPFIRGMLDAFVVFPPVEEDNRPTSVKATEALRSDWENVGKSLWFGISKFKEENNIQDDDPRQMVLPLGKK